MKSYKVLASFLVLFLLIGALPSAPITAAPLESLSALNSTEAAEPHLSDFSASSVSSVVQDDATRQVTLNALHNAPLMFIENAGQFPDGARFQVRGGDRTIWLAEDALWVTVVETPHPSPRPPGGGHLSPLSAAERGERPGERGEVHGVNIKFSFVGANPHPRLEPFNRLDTHVSYFLGNDPAQWRTDVPVWAGVRYVDLYPGVDLEVTGEGGRWTWRLVCGEADCQSALRDVRLRVEGADGVALTPSPASEEGQGGGLRLTTAVGEFTLLLLTVEGTVPDGQPATCNLEPETFDVTFPFSLSPPLPLSVSPQDNPDDLLYATFLGGSDDDSGRDIAVDASGAAYVTGSTASSDFPTTPGAFDTNYNGGDGFVVKVNADGTGLTYATFLSSGGSIAVDGAGNAYITGMTSSSDFPTTAGAFDRTYNGGYCDAFVVKLNADGTALTYATFLGGSDWDWGHAIAVDGSGAAYITGWTNSSNFPTTPGAFDRIHNGAGDIFVAKLNATGSALAYATFVGGDAGDRGLAIAVDESGAAYVTGEAGWGWPHEFPTTPGAFDRSHDGYDDAFVVKLNPAGSALVYATFLGGSNDEWGFAIAVDGNGAAYVTGSTNSSDFPTTSGAFDVTYNGGTCGADCQPRNDIFVTKVNPSGSDLIYSTFLGGSYDEWGNAIAVDGTGSAYITGRTESSDFPTTAGAFDTSLDGSDDVLLAKVNADGTGVTYATFLGGNGWDGGYGIAVNGSGVAYVTGRTESSDFPTTAGAFDTSLDGDTDAFVAKLAMGGGSGSFTGAVSPIWPAAHTTSGLVMQGGTAYRHLRLLDAGGSPIPDAIVAFSTGNPATTDAQGYFTATIPTSALGGPGYYQTSIQSVTIGGQTYSTNNQPAFGVQVTERTYSHSWSYGAIRQDSAGVSTGLIAYLGAETNGGLGLTLEESHPDRTDDDRVEMEEHYSVETSVGVGIGIRENISATIVKADLDASVTSEASLRHFGDLEAQFNQPYAENERKAQGIFLTLSILDSASGVPIQPLVVKMLRTAEARLPYLDYISAQSVGTGARVTPLRANVGAEVGLTTKRSGGQSKGKTLGFTLLDVGASRLVAMVLTDYGSEYSVGFEDELSMNMTMLSPNLPWIRNRLIGLLGNYARRLHKEYFFDSTTDQLKRIELTLSSEGNPNVFTDVTKKRVAVRMILEGGNLTPSLVEAVGEARAISDLNALLSAVPEIPYSVEVEDGSGVSVMPALSIPGTEIKIGMGLEVEKLRNLVRERGVFLNGKPYITESYNADSYVARPGKNWWSLTTNALSGLWLLIQDAFNWIAQQVISGVGWVIGTVSRTVGGIIRGGAQIIAPPGTQLHATGPGTQEVTIQQTTPITITAISWVPESTAGAGALAMRPALAAASGEGFVVGGIYEFQPYTLTLSPAATLVITYTDEVAAEIDESRIGMFRWNSEGNNWQPLTAVADTTHNVFTATITQLGTFALGYDDTPPQIGILTPADGSTISNTLPLISVLVSDTGVGIDPAAVEMRLDRQVVAATYITGTGELVYLPTVPLASGQHTVQVLARDVVGNDSSASATFTVEVTHRLYLPLILRNR